MKEKKKIFGLNYLEKEKIKITGGLVIPRTRGNRFTFDATWENGSVRDDGNHDVLQAI